MEEVALRAVHQFTRRSHRVRRIVTPADSDWERAGDVLGMIRQSKPQLRSKVLTLWNDLLIALCARQIGATVVTHNARDFTLLRRYLRLDLNTLP